VKPHPKIVLIFLALGQVAYSQDTWIGASGNWSTPFNWTSGSPANDGSASVFFGSASSFSSTVNHSWSISSLDVSASAGAFVLDHTGGHTLTVGGSFTDNSSNTVQADISLQGAMSLSVTGSGTLTLSQPNSYTGNTALSAGTLTDSFANTFSPASLMMVGSGSVLQVNNDETVFSLSDNIGGGTVDLASCAVLTLKGSGTENFSGVIEGLGGIQLQGTSLLTLSGTSTFSGTTQIGCGAVLVLGNSAGLGNSTVDLLGGGTLSVNAGVTVANALSFSGSGNVLTGNGTFASAVVAGAAVVLSAAAAPGYGPGNLTFTNPLTLATGATISFKLYDATGAAGVGYGLISAAGGLTFTAATNTITFDLVSTDASGNSAAAINFNPTSAYSWQFAASSSAIAGFSANQFALDTSAFVNGTAGGTFSFTEVGDNLSLNFTPVPEPQIWTLMIGGVNLLVLVARRRSFAGFQRR
jgi:autotransporter-associated beta strand protein